MSEQVKEEVVEATGGFIDELPPPPASDDSVNDEAVVISGEVASSMFDSVPKMGELIPVGAYHFRLEKYFEQIGDVSEDAPEAVKAYGKQPFFNIIWVCQQEPHTGMRYSERVGWCTPQVFADAAAGSPTARDMVRRALVNAKSILDATGYVVGPSFNIKDFFATHPETRNQVGVKGKQTKVDGKFKQTGEQQNFTIKHTSLRRPA